MSLIIAEVKDGAVYMGADTRTSAGDLQFTQKSANNLKIHKMPNGILLGRAGLVKATQILSCHKDWFEGEDAKQLSKEFIVTQIIPKLYRELNKRKLLERTAPARMEGTFLIAQGNRLFRIASDFSVIVAPGFDSIGCGQDAAFAIQELNADCPMREKFLKGLRLAASCDSTIAAPFVFIDTKTLEFEFVEE